jgi:hypothetical protein
VSAGGFGSSSVHGYLVTGDEGPREGLWRTSCHVTNWLDLRGQTAHVMVFDENLNQFLANAAQFGLTVQRIEGAGEDEHYQILVGDEADGWTPQKALDFARTQAAADRAEHGDFVSALMEHAPEEWDGDEAAESIAVLYLHHLEAEVDRLGGTRLPPWATDGAS